MEISAAHISSFQQQAVNTSAAYPLVTIVIPTYNRLHLVVESVRSVIAQSYQNWELIVVDDGSTDDTVDIINFIGDNRITVLEMPHCGNIARLRNIGVQYGSGEWVAFLDSDDVWFPNKLKLQIHFLNKEKKQWGYAGFELMNEDGIKIPVKNGTYKAISGNIIRPLITYEATVPIGSLIIKRTLFEKLEGFNSNPAFFCREDYELSLRLALHEDVVAVPDILVRIREHSGRSTNMFDNGPERSAFVYKHFLSLCTDKELRKSAKKQYTSQLSENALKNIRKKKYSLGIKQLISAFIRGNALSSIHVVRKAWKHHHKNN